MPAPLIQVAVSNGIVTLTGRVHHGDERLRAAALAERTRGVRAVVNRLVVEPVPAPLSDLAEAIRASLLEESEDEFVDVTVTADGSVVHLAGSVPRARGREMAEEAAWYVPGVTEVDNRIRVRPSFARTDREIAEDVERSLRADPYVGKAPLQVSVKDGHVTLSGSVVSMFERHRARDRAMLVGVVDVDDGAVRVLPETVTSGTYARPPATDRDMALAIRDAFRADPRVSPGVEVKVEYGVVTLTGWVRTLSAKLAAAEDARNAFGTWAVVDELEVRPREGAPADLAERVMLRLRAHPSVNAAGVRVITSGGVVTLTGAVSSVFERTSAERAVAAMPGVTRIDDQLEIRPARIVARSDAAIERDVASALEWDPRVENVNVTVAVVNGVVELRGRVPNGEVHDAVLENAFESGQGKVVDHLCEKANAEASKAGPGCP